MIRLQKQFDMRYERLALLAPRLPPLNFKMADYDQKKEHIIEKGEAPLFFFHHLVTATQIIFPTATPFT